jgi:deoxycytidylate deaminase
MFLAYASSLRSGSLARQVGAVITSKEGEVIATGTNDVPTKGGGLYQPGKLDRRDHIQGYDSNTKRRAEIVEDIMTRLAQRITFEGDPLTVGMDLLADSLVLDITEYGRDVHAEMDALLACARIGVSPRCGGLYTTTFPCHNCARHIVAAGIDRVRYVEPYPKSLADQLHHDSIDIDGVDENKVVFEPFVGVGPRRYFDLFSMSLGSGYPIQRKTKNGEKVEWQKKTARLRTTMLPTSYIDREQLSISGIGELLREISDGEQPKEAS